jgi:steroid delta-isomerase-like uncharacterized protein
VSSGVTTVSEPNLAKVVDAHEAAEAAHHAAGVSRTFSPDGILDPKSTGQTFTGRDAITGWYADLFSAFPDLTPALTKRHTSGNVVLDELVFTATHEGRFIGVPATDKPVKVAASVIYEVVDGPVVRESAYWDVAAMLIQMGVIPAPGR